MQIQLEGNCTYEKVNGTQNFHEMGEQEITIHGLFISRVEGWVKNDVERIFKYSTPAIEECKPVCVSLESTSARNVHSPASALSSAWRWMAMDLMPS